VRRAICLFVSGSSGGGPPIASQSREQIADVDAQNCPLRAGLTRDRISTLAWNRAADGAFFSPTSNILSRPCQRHGTRAAIFGLGAQPASEK